MRARPFLLVCHPWGLFPAKPKFAVAIVRRDLCLGRRTVKGYERAPVSAPIDPPPNLIGASLWLAERSCPVGNTSAISHRGYFPPPRAVYPAVV
jgi:hypothetical protein